MNTLGERLRSARLTSGLSPDEAGRYVGLDGEKITAIEEGRRVIGPLELMSLAEVFNVSLWDLTGEPAPTAAEEAAMLKSLFGAE
jgi:transcriptional regulator with XRE-family HTH domain